MKQETKEIALHIWQSVRMYLLVIFVTIICMANCKGCKHNTIIPIENKANVAKINHLDTFISERHKRLIQDSINMKLAYNNLHSLYIHAIKTAPDTCRSYIDTVYKEALVVDSTDRVTIARLDSTNQDLFIEIMFYKSIAHNDTLRINQLTDTIKTVKHKAFWRGVKIGAIGGAIITEAVNISTKFIK